MLRWFMMLAILLTGCSSGFRFHLTPGVVEPEGTVLPGPVLAEVRPRAAQFQGNQILAEESQTLTLADCRKYGTALGEYKVPSDEGSFVREIFGLEGRFEPPLTRLESEGPKVSIIGGHWVSHDWSGPLVVLYVEGGPDRSYSLLLRLEEPWSEDAIRLMDLVSSSSSNGTETVRPVFGVVKPVSKR